MEQKTIRGINILNPIDVDRDYYLKAIDFAIENNYNHIQINGPIHNFKHSNLDGMMFYEKYSQFNKDKDEKYVNYCLKVVNECLEKSHAAGIKTYMWHHEMEVPNGFMEAFPEMLNEHGDVEITHPIIKDFTESKLKEFFKAYPLMDGIVITFYETKIPLLRLKNQKLSTPERMEYVTRILYETCKSMGKELIVRVDATVEEDYKILLGAYEKVSKEMMIMEKWTQYDWSLSLPNNAFMKNITVHPLLIETDIFGEYFGKGMFPLMLKEHMIEKYNFCEQYSPLGYCNRIDRGGLDCFGKVNEVNLHIMKALLDGKDVDVAIDKFFFDKYGECGGEVKALMEKTEDVVRKTLFCNGYYYSELSFFPTINHSKNHFYFELMKEDWRIESNEWFVPVNYVRGDVNNFFNDLTSASETAEKLLDGVLRLKGRISEENYQELFVKFKNLQLVGKTWIEMTKVFYNYANYFAQKDCDKEKELFLALAKLEEHNKEGKEILGDQFFASFSSVFGEVGLKIDRIGNFIKEVTDSFNYEKAITKQLDSKNLTDYVVCGGGNEGHGIKKEVNFSDVLFVDNELVRIPGNRKGLDWSLINAHGWFSYQLKIKQNAENTIRLVVGGKTDTVNFKATIGQKEYLINQKNNGKNVIELKYVASKGEEKTRVQIDKISGHTPCVYTIEVL